METETTPPAGKGTLHPLVGRPLAFLQNAWVRDPDRLCETLARHDEAFRLVMLRRLLFSGCVTGRRLRIAFGPLCEQIVWEECTREIAGDPRTILPADRVHIAAAILRHAPCVVIAFGKHAADAVARLPNAGDIPLIFAPHPAARQPATMAMLKTAADRVRVHAANAPREGLLKSAGV